MTVAILTAQVQPEYEPGDVQHGQGWEGDARFSIRGMGNNDQMDTFLSVFPGIKVYRLPFNVDQFDVSGNLHPNYELAINRMAADGWSFLFDLHDGPVQETNVQDRIDNWPALYPVLSTASEWDDFFKPDGTVATTRLLPAWTKMLDWLDANPTIQVFGFEAINEPDGYSRLAGATGDLETAISYYAQTCSDIYDLIAARRSNFEYYIGGWNYSSTFDVFSRPVNDLGGENIVSYFRNKLSGSGNTLGWAIHAYPDWFGLSRNPDNLEEILDRKYSALYGDKMIITETNQNSGWSSWVDMTAFYRSHFVQAQMAPWFRKRGIGYTYWSATNYAAARLVNIEPNGDLTIYCQNSMAIAYAIMAATDREGNVLNGQQSGMIAPDVMPALLRRHGADTDYDPGDQYDDALTYAIGRGGAGYCVVTGDANSNNTLIGGEGRAVLYGGNFDDHLSLGFGGGVARTYGNQNQVYAYGPSLIYLGDGNNFVTCYPAPITLVVDPAGTQAVYGFRPDKDSISFMGAFANAAALDAATYLVTADTHYGDEAHLVVDLPMGGKLTFILASGFESVSGVCLDFTDGWYGSGWSEPDDYDPALFSTPLATKPPIELPSASSDSNVRNRDGVLLSVRNRDGVEVAVQPRV